MSHPAHPDFYNSWLGHGVVFDPTGGIATAALVGISTAVQAASTLAQGAAQKQAANYQAVQLNQQAGQARATAQRQAMEEQRKGAYALSHTQAVAAASGGGAEDPTVASIEGNIAGQSEYNQLTALFNGEERARGQQQQAATDIYSGKQAQTASYWKAAGTLAQGGETLYTKYGTHDQPTDGSNGDTSPGWIAPWQKTAPLPWSATG